MHAFGESFFRKMPSFNRERWIDGVWADRDRVCKRCHSILEKRAWNRRQEHKERKAGLQSIRYVLCGEFLAYAEVRWRSRTTFRRYCLVD